MLVYTDDRMRQYRLQDCNGWEIYRNEYHSGTRKYMVYENYTSPKGYNPFYDGFEEMSIIEYFWTLKEARAFARANQVRG